MVPAVEFFNRSIGSVMLLTCTVTKIKLTKGDIYTRFTCKSQGPPPHLCLGTNYCVELPLSVQQRGFMLYSLFRSHGFVRFTQVKSHKGAILDWGETREGSPAWFSGGQTGRGLRLHPDTQACAPGGDAPQSMTWSSQNVPEVIAGPKASGPNSAKPLGTCRGVVPARNPGRGCRGQRSSACLAGSPAPAGDGLPAGQVCGSGRNDGGTP